MALLNELNPDNNPYDKDGAIDWLLQTLIKHGGQTNLYPLHGRNSPKSEDIIWAQDLLASQGYIRRVHNAIGVTFAITEQGKIYFYKRIYDKVVARLAKANEFVKVSSILTDLRIEDEEGELSNAIETKLIKEEKVFATEESGIMLKPSVKDGLLHSKFGLGSLNTETVGGNQSSEIVRNSPRMDNTNSKIPTKPKTRSRIEMVAWIIGIITGLTVIYEFILKHVFKTPSLF